jgi:hypothetical protein
MTAGAQPTLNSINTQAGQIALSIRNDMQSVIWFNGYLNALGGTTFLESLNMTSQDAATTISTFGNLVVVATAYQGNGLIAATFDYEENSQSLWGGN